MDSKRVSSDEIPVVEKNSRLYLYKPWYSIWTVAQWLVKFDNNAEGPETTRVRLV